MTFRGHSKSLAVALFDSTRVTSYMLSAVTMLMSRTVSETLALV